MRSSCHSRSARRGRRASIGIRENMRLVRRIEARRVRRRTCLSLVAVAILTLTLLIAQPAVGSFSVFEDPRPGGYAIMLGRLETTPESPAPPKGETPSPADEPATEEPIEGSGDQGAPTNQPQGEGGPEYYVVQPKDSLSSISEAFGVSVSDLWIANRLINPHSLQPGQTLLIPAGPEDVFGEHPGDGDGEKGSALAQPVYHTVRTGENLWTIASRYGVTVNEIARANQISSSGTIQPGQELEIPNAAGPATASGSSLTWPVFGTISSPFGMRHGVMHQGLDIAADRGTAIRAAAAGRVKSTGWMGNYGNTLVIDHGNGMSTLYAHCDKLLVSKGQQVTAGQQIALLGNTGRSTGPHVHFEVIVNGKRYDPLRYLLL